jgi:hypothetical protein
VVFPAPMGGMGETGRTGVMEHQGEMGDLEGMGHGDGLVCLV